MSDAATAIHFYEAILATGSILVWHFYMVIFDPDVYPMDMAWLTGKVLGRRTCVTPVRATSGGLSAIHLRPKTRAKESLEPTDPPKDPDTK